MEENTTGEPLEANKDNEIIKECQTEITKLDVLVCGSCHEVFHFIDEFKTHKTENCPNVSSVKESYTGDANPQVWAFMLWKSAQFKKRKEGEPPPTAWAVYQRWCRCTSEEKEPWIIAARNVQVFLKLSSPKMLELLEKKGLEGLDSFASIKDSDDGDEGEMRLSLLTEAQRLALKAQSDDTDALGGIDYSEDDLDDPKFRKMAKTNDLIKKGIVKPVRLNSDVKILPSVKKNIVAKSTVRSNPEDSKDEYVVEKIISKRFNPRKKTFEYLIKWENFDNRTENSWEPIANLDACKEMLKEFEANLQKQKLAKMKANLAAQREKKEKEIIQPIQYTPRGRPQRTSKQKALNQVKVWCGDISDADEDSTGKRRHEDDDSDEDSVEKKIKREVEENTESSDDEMYKSGVSVKKIIRQPQQKSVNGVEKQPIPPNILIPDSQGIIRINQKQASELSSGVYIMSKTAGIIKLDSNTSKMATSGGQTIVKVAPKIGQTHIKVVKKDSGSNVIRLTPKVDDKSKGSTGKVAIQKLPMKATGRFTPKQFVRKKSVEPPKQASPVDKVEFPPLDDESDGLSELEFPTDLPIPPDSPPGELTLDPITGKLIGVEYPPDKEVVISEEKPREIYMGLVNQAKEKENLLKEEETTIKDKPEQYKTENVSEEVAEFLSKPSAANTSSILQRKLLSTPARHVITKTPSRQHLTPQRQTPQNKSVVRTRIMPPKQKQVLPTSPATPTITRVRHSYVNKNAVPKKIGQTTIYRTSAYGKPQKPEPAVTITKSPRRPQQQQQQQQIKQEPQTTISMPSLSTEPDAVAAGELEQIGTLSVPETLADLTSLVELQDSSESPLMLTGEDGTVYQVAGQNEQGQTVLISQGADGEQQCLVVATESLQVEDSSAAVATGGVSSLVQMTESDAELQETLEGEPESDSSNEEMQVVAQLIGADPPSPGGKRNVTVMLPDGSCVTMSVTQEQYEALEIDK